MTSHFLVQPTRYAIVGIAGCTPSLSNTWPSACLIILPPALLALVNVYYALLILVRLRLHRRTFAPLLSASSTTKARFVRLYLLALGFVLLVFPVTLYLLFQNWPRDPSPFDWGKVHDYQAWKQIAMVPCFGYVGVDKWMQVVAGGLVFGLFGVGSEARGMYKGWLRAVGLGGVVTWMERMGQRVKRCGRKGSRGSVGESKGRGRLLSSFSFGSGLGRKGSHGSGNKSELETGTGTA
ncbi:pheromone A receptor-domain-containing protein [Elsinoe ampelina]|uniref:Pheromone A receptor-domain-containing protein n=1 Tax=Elsinoe ampelina TaxID=302913 RepID=A0A6A6FYM0_9PEZI|nr:pheromone A receptor-domain-containing protein [Elsinoe ampelina]